MKTTARKTLSLVLSVLLTISLMPVSVFAENIEIEESQEVNSEDLVIEQGADEVTETPAETDSVPIAKEAPEENLGGQEEINLENSNDSEAVEETTPVDNVETEATVSTDGTEEEVKEPSSTEIVETEDAVLPENEETEEVAPTEEEETEDSAQAEEPKEEADEAEKENEEPAAMPAFAKSVMVDGVRIAVSAPEGTFPEGAKLEVTKVSRSDQSAVDQAVDAARANSVNVAASYTFDIKVIDKDGKEIQPADGKKVNVSFALAEVANQNLVTDVYHVSEEGGSLNAEALNTSEQGTTVTVKTDGFSFYTVEFTYDEKQYVMNGDTTIALSEILDYVGLSGTVSAVSVSDESLFSASNENGEWLVTAHKAFSTEEWMKVTIDGVEYEIVVTDAGGPGQYTITVTSSSYKFYYRGTGSDQDYTLAIRLHGKNNNIIASQNVNKTGTVTFTTTEEVDHITALFSGTRPVQVDVSLGGGTFRGSAADYTGFSYVGEITCTVNYPPAHEHNWSYSADGNVITATCGGSGTCSVGTQTATLSQPSDKSYDGTAVAEPTVTKSSGWTTANKLTEPSSVTIAPENSADAGTYTACVSVGDATATTTWTISAIDITPTVSMNGWIYGDSAQNPTISGNTGNGVVSYEYKIKDADDSTYSATRPSNAGEYTVRASVAASANYNAATATADFTIAKRDVTITADSDSKSYDGSPLTKNSYTSEGLATGDSVASVTVTGSQTDVGSSNNVPTDAVIKKGSTDVSSNYNITYANGTLTVIPATNNRVTVDITGWTYGDTPNAPTSTATFGADTVGYTYSDAEDGDFTDAVPTTAGTWYVKATVPTTDNYAGGSAIKSFTIAKKDLTVTANDNEITYGEKPAASGVTYDGFVSGESETDLTGELSYTYTYSQYGNVGTYKIIPGGLTSDNYDITFVNGNLTVGPKTVTNPTLSLSGDRFLYDEEMAVAPHVTVKDGDDIIPTKEYRVAYDNNEAPGDKDDPEAPSATVQDKSGGNYILVFDPEEKATVTFTIVPGESFIDRVPHAKTGLVYNGQPQELITAGTGRHGTPMYRLSSEDEWSPEVPKATDAGTYTVYYMVKGNENYNDWTGQDEGGQTLTVRIAPATVTITAHDKTKVYDNDPTTDPELTATVTGAVNGEEINYTLSRIPGQDADTYVIYVNQNNNPNYSIREVNGTFTITRKPLTITAGSDSKTYDGTELKKSTYTKSSDLGKGDVIDQVMVTGARTDAGTSANVPSDVVIKNGEDDKTSNYNITLVNGELKVSPRNVTLITASESKVYDGDPLTMPGVTVSGDGFAGEEGATYDVTGTQTLPGSSANTFTYTLKEGTKASNYSITKVEGLLTVTDRTDSGENRKYEIDIKGNGGTFKYDGETHTASGFETLDFTFNNIKYTVSGITASLTETDAGTYTVAITGTPVVKNPDGIDLTNQFIIDTLPGTLTINKRNVTITSGSASKQFDDEYLTDDHITITGDGFVPGEDATCDVTGKQKYVGSSKNSFTYTLENGAKEENYNITKVEGTLTVTDRDTKYEIAPQAKSDSVKYDGESHTASGFVTDTFTVDGHTYTVSGLTATASGTDAGTYTVSVSGTAVVKDADGEDVTAEFSVLPKAGTLTITKRSVTLTSASDTKVYDGSPLTNDEITVGGDGWAEGEGATYTVTGSRTAAGTSENTFNYALNTYTKADNYNITKHYGSLTVNHRAEGYKITLKANSLTDAKYDGTEKVVSGYTIGEAASADNQTCTFEAENGKTYTISGVKAEVKATNAGTYTVNITGTPVIKDSEGVDETAEFVVTNESGTLVIAKRNVSLASPSDSKTYDGSALTKEEVTVGGDGWAEGEGANYVFTGTQTLPGESENTFSYDLDEGTSADNYEITTSFGKLTVNHRSGEGDDKKFEITVKATSKTATYDGQEKEVSGFETLSFNVGGVKYTVEGLTASVKGTDAGTYTSVVTGTPVVKNTNGDDLTSEFIVNTEDGTLTINKRNVTLTSATASKPYDGDALTNDTVTVTGDKFAAGEGATYTVTGKQTIPGSSDNHFSYTLNDGTKADNYVITKVEGKLTILDRDEASKYEIAPQAKSDTVKYDGQSHSVSGLVTDTFTVEGHKYTVSGLTATGSGTDAGGYAVRVSGTAIVKDADGNDVTKEFDVLPKNGTLTINKRDITFTSASDSKVYDGKPLTKKDVTVSGDGFVAGEGATYNVTGTRTVVGTSDNTFTYTMNAGTKADNYNVTTSYGTLTVNHRDTKYKVTLKANSGTEKYDGEAKTVEGYKIGEAASTPGDNQTCTFTAENGEEYTLSGMTATASGTNAGEYTVNITGTPVIEDAAGNDETSEFEIAIESGKLIIEKRTVTLTSATESKKFDGSTLTNDHVTVGGNGWADGEGAHYTFTGTQTLPGSSDNTFSYDLNEGTLAGNYNITTTFGKLTVTDRPDGEKYEITLKPKSGTFTYDGGSHMVSGFEQTEFTFDGKTYTVVGPIANASGQDAGTYPVEVTNATNLKVLDADNNDLTKEFIVNIENANLVINKRNVTMTSATDSKVFDDEALTNDTVTVTGDGFASGEGATYDVTGSQTTAGSSPNHFTYTLNSGTKADNYRITTVEGTLTVTHRSAKYEIAPQAKSDTVKYDGKTHEVSGFVEDTFTVDGHTYTVSGLTAEASGKDAGNYTVKVSGTPVVMDANGVDVTEEFSVQPKSGTLSITKRSVTLTSGNATKEFDDEPLTNDEVTISGDGFIEGEGATYNVTGTRTVAGTAENTFYYTLKDNTKADNYDITKVYGSLTVNHKNTKFEITLKAESGSEKYDGSEKTVSGYKIGSAASTGEGEQTCKFEQGGHTYTISGMTAKVTEKDAGEYVVNVTGTPVIKDSNDNDVTSEFEVSVEAGKLEIEKRELTLTSATDSKAYNGSPLINKNVTVGGDGFASGEGAQYNFTGTQTLPGTSANSFTYTLNEGTKAGNYSITKEEGTLTVADRIEKYEIALKPNGGEFTYDGEEHEVSGFETMEFTFDGVKYTVSEITASAKGTDARTYEVVTSGEAKVTDPAGNDLTREFKINIDGAKLVINKRSVTLTSATESKEYDGNPLTNDEIAVSGEGWASGEGATYDVTGSQTLVGSSANTFSYELNDGTNADNYTITKNEGTLTITSRDAKFEIAPKAKSETVKYNGKEQTAAGLETDTFEANGHKYTVSGLTVEGGGTDAGDYTVNATGTAVVEDADGNDVTSEFSVVPKSGTLTISKREVTLTSATETKEYNGSPLTNDEITVGGDGWASEEGATYNVTGTRTLVGTVENAFTYTLNDNTKAANYDITTSFGTLTVTNRSAKYEVTLLANSKTELYDGTEKSVSGYTIGEAASKDDLTCTFTAENGKEYTISGMTAEVKGLDAGTYTVNIVGTPLILDADGNDETEQFAVKVESGALTIEKRKVTLTSASASKDYDGTALTNNEVTVSGDGFAEGQGARYEVTGSQTEAGTSNNTFTYTLEEGTKAENYEITTVEGTLTVVADEEELLYFDYSGDGSEWIEGETETLTFVFKRSVNDEVTFDHFTGIAVDGKDVDSSNYTAVAGSVVVTLKKDFIETLATGKHTLTAKFDDGNNVTVDFTVTRKTPANPSSTTPANSKSGSKNPVKTGDSTDIALYLIIFGMSVAGVIAAARRKQNK